MRSIFKKHCPPNDVPVFLREGGRKLKALMVDSDERFQKKLIAMASAAHIPEEPRSGGLEVLPVQTLRDAIQALEKNRFEIILTDINLADASGFLVIEELFEFGKGTPIIVLGNIRDGALLVQSAKAGISDFLVKESLGPDILMRSVYYAIERKALELKTKDADLLYRSLVDMLPLGLMRFDKSGVLIYVNQVVTKIAGLAPDSMLGRTLEAIFDWHGITEAQQGIRHLLDGNRDFDMELSRDDNQVGAQYFHLMATSMRGDNEETTGVQCILQDITCQKQFQKESDTAHSLKMLQAEHSKLAHELNNVFASILLDAENLGHPGKDVVPHEIIRRITHSVETARSVLRPFLISSQQVGPRCEWLDVVKIIQHAVETFRTGLPDGILLETQIDPHINAVQGDASLLEKVMIHLLHNAAESMTEGGLVRLIARMENLEVGDTRLETLELNSGPHLHISITDEGEGIAPHLVQRIFEPFYTTKGTPHTGIGLSEALGVIRGHRGNIHVNSQMGVGTEVCLYLPVQKDLPATVATESGKPDGIPHGTRHSILVVDDEQNILHSAKMLLQHFGYDVIVASNGAEALSLYNQHQADIGLVIADFEMPIMDGPGMIQALRRMAPSLKIILCTGMEAQDSVDQVSGLAIDGVLFKPFSGTTLKSEIEKHLK